MLFHAGRFGMVDVDEVIEQEGRKIAVKNLDRLTSIFYIYYGEKDGCTKITMIPPKTPDNCGEEARKTTKYMINDACNRAAQNLSCRAAGEEDSKTNE